MVAHGMNRILSYCLTTGCAFLLAAPGCAWSQPARTTLSRAIRYALAHNTHYHIAISQRRSAYGQWQQSLGPFDPVLSLQLGHTKDHSPLTPLQQQAYQLPETFQKSDNAYIGLSKLLPNGWTLTPSFQAEHTVNTQQMLQNLPAENDAHVDITLNIPLWRNATTTLSGTRQSLAQYQATLQQSIHEAAVTIRDTALAYDSLLLDQKILALQKVEAFAKRSLLQKTKVLVKNDATPRSNITLVEADWLLQKTHVDQAQQNVTTAQMNLALQMNRPTAQLRHLQATGSFLSYRKVQLPALTTILSHRHDYQAQRFLLKKTHQALLAANQDTKPQASLQLTGGYDSIHEGPFRLDASTENVASFDYGVQLNVGYPMGNHEKNGSYLTHIEQYNQSYLTARNLKQSIDLNTHTTMHQLLILKHTFEISKKSTRLYQKAVHDAFQKATIGSGTVLDLIKIQEDLRQIQLNKLQIQAAIMQFYVTYLYQTGQLITQRNHRYHVNMTPFHL